MRIGAKIIQLDKSVISNLFQIKTLHLKLEQTQCGVPLFSLQSQSRFYFPLPNRLKYSRDIRLSMFYVLNSNKAKRFDCQSKHIMTQSKRFVNS